MEFAVTLIFRVGFYVVYSFLRSSRLAHTLSRATKYAKRSFAQEVRKLKASPSKFQFLSFLSTLSAHLRGGYKFILIGDVSVSPLCSMGTLFRTTLFKTALIFIDRYFSAFQKVNSIVSHASLSLTFTNSQSDIR